MARTAALGFAVATVFLSPPNGHLKTGAGESCHPTLKIFVMNARTIHRSNRHTHTRWAKVKVVWPAWAAAARPLACARRRTMSRCARFALSDCDSFLLPRGFRRRNRSRSLIVAAIRSRVRVTPVSRKTRRRNGSHPPRLASGRRRSESRAHRRPQSCQMVRRLESALNFPRRLLLCFFADMENTHSHRPLFSYFNVFQMV